MNTSLSSVRDPVAEASPTDRLPHEVFLQGFRKFCRCPALSASAVSQGHPKLCIHLPREAEEQDIFIQNLSPPTCGFAALSVSSRGPGRTHSENHLPACISGSLCRICLQLSERWSSSSPSFPFPVPQGNHGGWFVGALRKVWGAGERGSASAAWIAWVTSSLSPHAPEYQSVEFLGRQEVV